MERLQKFMARHGVASRRACEDIIAAGKVKVNGKTVTSAVTLIDPSRDKVMVDGRRLGEPEKPVYIMMYKPRGYISSVKDPRGRKVVTDLLDDVQERVYPIGRLDYDSEGLLLLTNDGDLTLRLTHPAHGITKTYRVRVRGVPRVADIENLSAGIMLEDGITAPARVEFIEEREGNALLEVTIREGRNRQIRRMFEAVGYKVIRLKRTRIGDLSLGNMKPGQYRRLSPSELNRLKKLAAGGISKQKNR